MSAADQRFTRTYPLFPGRRPGRTTMPVESGSVPRLNGMPEPVLYAYRGTGTDTLTPHVGLYVSDECWDEKCARCSDPVDCLCACEHPGRTS